MSHSLADHVQEIADRITHPPEVTLNGELPEDVGLAYHDELDCFVDGELTPYETRSMDASDFLQDVLDIEYIVASDRKTMLGSRILVTFGGPNIWINTRHNTVEGHWWGERATAAFDDNLGLDDYIEELWGCQ